MTTIVCVANQKGGVGKTTTAVTLGHGLARRNLRVLLVDLDPQGHVAFGLGLNKAPGLHRLIIEQKPLDEVVVSTRSNLEAVLSDKSTEGVKRYVTTLNFRERVLLKTLEHTRYDLIVIDTAPSLDVLHVAALVASNWVIIPTKLDALAVDGVNEILRSIAEITQSGYPLDGYCILPTFFERTTKETMVQLKEVATVFGRHVWPPIPQDTKAREAAAYGKTLLEYSPHSPVVRGYQNGKSNDYVGGYAEVIERMMEVIHG
jgi:chromosome partitioning protein